MHDLKAHLKGAVITGYLTRSFSKKVRERRYSSENQREKSDKKKRRTYLYEVGKEQDVGGGRPHVSPWGIPSTTAYHRYPRAVPRPLPPSTPSPRCPLAVLPLLSAVSLVLSFSHHSHRILSIAIIGTLAHRRSFRSAHQHRIISTGPVSSPRGGTNSSLRRSTNSLNTRRHFV